MNLFTISLFGHRKINNILSIEHTLEQTIRKFLYEKEFVEFLIGRDGEFDQLAASVIRRCKRIYRGDNSSLVWVMPYQTAEFRDNEDYFREYYDDIEVCTDASNHHFKSAFRVRNQHMVDRSDLVVFYIEHTKGGASQTMHYAQQHGKSYINIYKGKL